ncbi:MAG: AmmeMemoRadiSam system protein B [Spirochaetales bacterium]|nr:AmmeMemoRadiSam system protein B [Spirochaetales bacterium]
MSVWNDYSRYLVMNPSVRPACGAGSFYPATFEDLQVLVHQKLAGKAPREPQRFHCFALAVPHAGYRYSATTAGYAFAWLAAQPPQELSLWGPSHHFAFSGLAANPYTAWSLPGKDFSQFSVKQVSQGFVSEADSKTIHRPEHSLEVELPFLREVAPEAVVDAILFGQSDPESVLKVLCQEKPPLIVVSTDLSHYHLLDEAQHRDLQYLDDVRAGRVGKVLKGEACGRVPLAALVLLAQQNHWECRLLHYETSAAASGDTSSVVGYAALVWGIAC